MKTSESMAPDQLTVKTTDCIGYIHHFLFIHSIPKRKPQNTLALLCCVQILTMETAIDFSCG